MPLDAPGTRHSESPARVLVVDDEPYLRELVCRWLVEDGFRCDTADSAQDALQRLEAKPCELVISDINMPGTDGIELLRRIKARHADSVAVLMASALQDRDVAIRALELGAYGYAIKPLQPNELLIQVSSALERRKLTLRSLAWQEQLEAEVRSRTAAIRRREEEIAWRLIRATDSRDDATGAHAQRIGSYARSLARAIGWRSPEMDDIRLAAAMHDVGKIGVPDSILRKPAKLTAREMEVMKRHTVLGARILQGSPVPLLQLAAEIARSHHERWDGTGYPDGLAGEDIPESARIVAIVDVYDALRFDRPYRAALSRYRVMQIMRDGRGSHFDPRIFDAFMNVRQNIAELEQIAFPGHAA